MLRAELHQAGYIHIYASASLRVSFTTALGLYVLQLLREIEQT
jgi:hypothetical protein